MRGPLLYPRCNTMGLQVTSMSIEKPGVLALWHDCASPHHPEFEHWYQTEHLFERLSIDGFLRGRRYVTCGEGPEFFTYYETRSATVLQSAGYLRRLNNPTDMTRRVMSGMFTNMSRTICDVIARAGRFRGSYACTLKLNVVPTAQQTGTLLESLAGDCGVARVELWTAVDIQGQPSTTEERMRGGDSRIVACVLIEVLRERDLSQVADLVAQVLSVDVECGFYRLLCELETENSPGQSA